MNSFGLQKKIKLFLLKEQAKMSPAAIRRLIESLKSVLFNIFFKVIQM